MTAAAVATFEAVIRHFCCLCNVGRVILFAWGAHDYTATAPAGFTEATAAAAAASRRRTNRLRLHGSASMLTTV